MSGSIIAGATYLTRGFRLLLHPALRRFVLVPIFVNLLLFIILTTLLIQQFAQLLDFMMIYLPSWLGFLAWIILALLALFVVLVYGYSFSLITNVIAAPFYGFLAERAEELVTGKRLEGETLLEMIPRTMLRELRKVWYFLWRGLVVLLLAFIPLVGPLIAAFWAAWSMSIQYSDYAADNHQRPFHGLRRSLRRRAQSSMGFGVLVMLGMMVPLLNILVIPAAVIGGTLFWLEELQDQDHLSWERRGREPPLRR